MNSPKEDTGNLHVGKRLRIRCDLYPSVSKLHKPSVGLVNLFTSSGVTEADIRKICRQFCIKIEAITLFAKRNFVQSEKPTSISKDPRGFLLLSLCEVL